MTSKTGWYRNSTYFPFPSLSRHTPFSFRLRLPRVSCGSLRVINITPGATIEPANGSVQDFTEGPVVYVVTSQDGELFSVKEIATRRVMEGMTLQDIAKLAMRAE